MNGCGSTTLNSKIATKRREIASSSTHTDDPTDMLRTTATRSLQLTSKRAFATSVARSDKPILPPSSKPSTIDQPTNSTTHFGFKDVPEQLKESLGELYVLLLRVSV